MKMNKQEEREYIQKLFIEYNKNKSKALRDELIERNLYMAEILAKKYTNRGIDYDDIFQVASVGLIYAVDRFNVSKGFQFSSFAVPTIVGEIKKHFRDKGWTIRVPRRIQELSKRINNARVELSQELQKSPTISELAEYLEATEEEILETMEASQVYSPQSLDIKYSSQDDDGEVSLMDFLGEEEINYNKIEDNDLLLETMEILNEVEKQILEDRYFNKETQVVIAEKLGISQMTVSRMEKRIIEKLRKEMEKMLI